MVLLVLSLYVGLMVRDSAPGQLGVGKYLYQF